MGQWIFAWLKYWQALYVRGFALLFVLVVMWAGSFIFGAPLLLLGEAFWPNGGLGVVLVSVTVFPILAGVGLGIFDRQGDPESPSPWWMHKIRTRLHRDPDAQP